MSPNPRTEWDPDFLGEAMKKAREKKAKDDKEKKGKKKE